MHLFGILCVIIFGISSFVEALNCDIFVDITDGTRDGNTITKNGITYTPENYFEDQSTVKGCICNVIQCVRKCCEDGQVMNLTTRKCVRNKERNFLPNYTLTSIIHVPENKICDESEVKIKIDQDFYVENGELVWDTLKFAMDNFCLAITPENETYAIACVTNEEAQVDRFITCLGNVKLYYNQKGCKYI